MVQSAPRKFSNARESDPAAEITEQQRHWLQQNLEAMNDWNDYVAEHGLPLAAFRRF